MDKTVHSYTKTTDQSVFGYTFHLTREKAEEVREFVEAYIGEQWRIVDHLNRQIVGYNVGDINELSYVHPHAGVTPLVDYGYTLNEKVVWNLEFEGTIV